MNAAHQASSLSKHGEKQRYVSADSEPSILTDIYDDDSNMVIWQRQFAPALQQCIDGFMHAKPTFSCSMTVSPQRVVAALTEAMAFDDAALLREEIHTLVDMFCCLFDLKQAGLRISILDKAMCPKFHVDRVPCRLITTFHGIATEWLAHEHVDRSKLGAKSLGLSDDESGLYQLPQQIQQIHCADVALLKGELWHDNEGAGLVHRSPALADGEKRLLMTLDFSD